MISLLLVALVCYALVFYLPVPFVWIAAIFIGYAVWRVRRSRATFAKIAWLNLGVAVLVLGIVEATLWLASASPGEFDPDTAPHHGFVLHPDYGYGPLSPSRTHVIKQFDGTVAYDVVYTIEANGLRLSPPESGRGRGCVLFMGCSNTFGEGVADDQTMPWQVGVKTGGDFAVRNFGFQGWGPHQMLAALESGNVERAARCEVTHIVYLALYWHALRSAGRVSWDLNGPRYVLEENGELVRAGYFSDVPLRSPLPEPILARLKRSFLYQKYFAHRLDPYSSQATPKDLDLLAAIVGRARSEAAKRFPKATFHVLLWDVWLPPRMATDLTERIARTGVSLHLVSKAIPDYPPQPNTRYKISSSETHPNADAYARLADYVVAHILEADGDNQKRSKRASNRE